MPYKPKVCRAIFAKARRAKRPVSKHVRRHCRKKSKA